MKKRVFIWGIFLGLLIIVSLYFDKEIVKAVVSIRTDILNDFFIGLTSVGSEIIIFFFLTSLFLWNERKRKWILPLWVTLGASVVVSYILKISVQRLRPYQLGIVSTFDILQKTSHVVWDFSFPSFQAMLAFCAVPILAKEFPKFKYIWIIFAGLVAFSRVYFGLHFLSDVLIGGLIGYIIGAIIVKLENENKFGEKTYKKLFRNK